MTVCMPRRLSFLTIRRVPPPLLYSFRDREPLTELQ